MGWEVFMKKWSKKWFILSGLLAVLVFELGLLASPDRIEISFPNFNGSFAYGQSVLASIEPGIRPPTHVSLEARPEGSLQWIPLITQNGDRFVSISDPRITFDAERLQLSIKWDNEPEIAGKLAGQICTLRLEYYLWPWRWAIANVEKVILSGPSSGPSLPSHMVEGTEKQIQTPKQVRPEASIRILEPNDGTLWLGDQLIAELTGLADKKPTAVTILVQQKGDKKWMPLITYEGQPEVPLDSHLVKFVEGRLYVPWEDPQSLKDGQYTVRLSVRLSSEERIEAETSLQLRTRRRVSVTRQIALLPGVPDCSEGLAIIPQNASDTPFIVEVKLTLKVESPDVLTILLKEIVPDADGIRVGAIEIEPNGLTVNTLRGPENTMIWQLINISKGASFMVIYELEIYNNAKADKVVELIGEFQPWISGQKTSQQWEMVQGENRVTLTRKLPLLTAVANLGKRKDGSLFILPPRISRPGEQVTNDPTVISLDQYWLALEAWQLGEGKIPYVGETLTPEYLAQIYAFAASGTHICGQEAAFQTTSRQ